MPEPSRQSSGSTPAREVPSLSENKTALVVGRGNLGMLIGTCGIVSLMVVAVFFFVKHKSPNTAPAPVPAESPAAVLSAGRTSSSIPPQPPLPVAAPASSVPNSADPCRAIWTFDQNSGTTVPDLTGHGYNGVVQGKPPIWIKAINPDGIGMESDGSTCVEIAGPVINTTRSFTVSAWVNLATVAGARAQTFVSIDGIERSGFSLDFVPNKSAPGGQLAFGRSEYDSKDAREIEALAGFPAKSNTWYHVAGVYDSRAQSLSLYVDGKLEKIRPFTNIWEANGKTVIGRGEWDGRRTHWLVGSVRDVRIYATALKAAQIKEIAR